MDNGIEIPLKKKKGIKLPYAPACIFLDYGYLWN